MKIGINHPWHNNGWDFGPPPKMMATDQGQTHYSTWRDAVPRHSSTQEVTTRVDASLDLYRRLGISAVRWFILADGWNLGTPTFNTDDGWQFTPPQLDGSYLAHFNQLLEAFRKARMPLIPSLISQEFFGPGRLLLSGKEVEVDLEPMSYRERTGLDDFVRRYFEEVHQDIPYDPQSTGDYRVNVKGGRAAVLKTADTRQVFFDSILQPLLASSSRGASSDVLMAWELINEPELAVKRGIKQSAMDEFMIEGIRRITQAGFTATIGFQTRQGLEAFTAHPVYGPIIRQLTRAGAFLPQYHYYPDQDRQPELTKAPDNCILGEIATALAPPGTTLWPGETEAASDHQLLTSRLKRVRTNSYPWVFLWSANGTDPHSRWDESILNAVKNFTAGSG